MFGYILRYMILFLKYLLHVTKRSCYLDYNVQGKLSNYIKYQTTHTYTQFVTKYCN